MIPRRGFLQSCIPALLVATSLGWSWGDVLRSRADRAMDLYEQGKTEEAIELYREEAIENPDRPDIAYNLGNMLYRDGKFPDTLPHYGKAAETPDADLKSRVIYNTGNSLARIGMSGGDAASLEKALAAFKESMKLAPGDADAKYNYEFVRRLLDEQQEQSGNQSPPDSSSGENEEQQENQESEGQEGEDGENEQQQEQDQDEQQKQQQEQRQEEPQEDEQAARNDPKKSMTQEDAARMLEALLGKEEEQLAKQFRALWPERVDVEKDW